MLYHRIMVQYRRDPLVTGEFYHVYSRGVEKRVLVLDDDDRQHFVETLSFFLEESLTVKLSQIPRRDRQRFLNEPPDNPLIEVLAFCVMPNHFHLLVRQLVDDGISTFFARALNSYTRYFNRRHDRVGPLFQGRFKAVRIITDEQLLHVIRYIHLNPVVAGLSTLESFPWSSHHLYVNESTSRLVSPQIASELLGDRARYQSFVADHEEYAKELHRIQHLTIEN